MVWGPFGMDWGPFGMDWGPFGMDWGQLECIGGICNGFGMAWPGVAWRGVALLKSLSQERALIQKVHVFVCFKCFWDEC